MWGRRMAAPINSLTAHTKSQLKTPNAQGSRAERPAFGVHSFSPNQTLTWKWDRNSEMVQPTQGILVSILRVLLPSLVPNLQLNLFLEEGGKLVLFPGKKQCLSGCLPCVSSFCLAGNLKK